VAKASIAIDDARAANLAVAFGVSLTCGIGRNHLLIAYNEHSPPTPPAGSSWFNGPDCRKHRPSGSSVPRCVTVEETPPMGNTPLYNAVERHLAAISVRAFAIESNPDGYGPDVLRNAASEIAAEVDAIRHALGFIAERADETIEPEAEDDIVPLAPASDSKGG
jgi:hypothetical protein